MCTLIDEIQTKITECMKSDNSFERDILKTVLGEIQTLQARTGKMDNDGVIKTFKKFKVGVEETIQILEERDALKNHLKIKFLKAEIDIYDEYIPATLSVEDIVKFLDTSGPDKAIHSLAIIEANSDGQATGMAMGILKKSGMAVDGKDVSEAVKKIRA